MWALYTRALAAAPSAAQASVVNSATNFLAAAAMGWAVFGEQVNALWWIGVGFLVAGTVVVAGGRGGEEEGRDGRGKGREKRE